MPVREGAFDAVVSCYVAKYCDLDVFLAEVCRYLKRGGRLTLYDFTSPQGYGTYIKASVASPNGSLVGPPIVKNIALPASLQARFAAVKQIGNTEKSGTSGVGARGFDDYQPSVRTWVNLVQQYLSNRMSTAQFARAEEQNIQSNWENVLKFEGLRDSDLRTPWKQPPTRTL